VSPRASSGSPRNPRSSASGNPSSTEKAAAGWLIAKDDKAIPAPWIVEDGALSNGADGGKDICTAEQFESYELELDYRIGKGGNSGVYLRGWVEVQILDSNGQPQPRDFDAGAIYGQHAPLVLASKPAGEWNHFRILHVGDRVTVWLNGSLVQDDVLQPKSTPGHMGEYPGTEADFDGKQGPIVLQGDHSRAWFKEIKIRPLVSASDGWRPLWNGKDLSEFTARGDSRAKDGLRWKIEDGAFTNVKWGGEGHNVWTNGSFGNFLVHYEYRSDPKIEGGNAGFIFVISGRSRSSGRRRPTRTPTAPSTRSTPCRRRLATGPTGGTRWT
jgi:hypothetical protein